MVRRVRQYLNLQPCTVVLTAALWGSLVFTERSVAQESIDELITSFILHEDDPVVRCDVLVALGKRGRDDSRTLPLLVACLTNESPRMRLAAAQGLRSLGTDAKDAEYALQTIAKRLDDKDDLVGQECTLCLLAWKGKGIGFARAESVPGRIRLMWLVGEVAPEVLANKDDKFLYSTYRRKMLSLLLSGSKAEAATLRVAALRAFSKVEEFCIEAWPELTPRLDDEDTAVRRQAVLAFDRLCAAPPSKLRDEAIRLSRPTIEALSQNDASESVRSTAKEALEKLAK